MADLEKTMKQRSIQISGTNGVVIISLLALLIWAGLCCVITAQCHGVALPEFIRKLDEKFLHPLKHPEAKISICYQLPTEKWLTFNLPPATDAVKLVTNANIPQDVVPEPETPVLYQMAYQIVDNKGRILKSGVYAKRSKITWFTDGIEPHDPFTASYYFSEPLVPADGRVTILNFQKQGTLEKNIRVRLRLAGKDSIVSSVMVRLYHNPMSPEQKLIRQWNRSSRAKKEFLARPNVYSHDFLTEQEQRNLMRNIWRPLAPAGIEGNDYTYRKLYVIKEVDGTSLNPERFPKGLRIDPHLRRTIPVPEQGLGISFLFRALPPGLNGDEPGVADIPDPHIRLQWFGKGITRRAWDIPWQGDATRFSHAFSGGLIELSSDRPVTVQLFTKKDGQSIDITPQPLVSRTILVNSTQSVTYRISHVKQLATPFRIGIREPSGLGRPGSSNQHPAAIHMPSTLHYDLLDKSGNKIHGDQVSLVLPASVYDRLIDGQDHLPISDPHYLHFNLPHNVSFIRLKSSDPLLVNAGNRSPKMAKLTRVPEDYFKSQTHDPDIQKQPTWFPLKPVNYNKLFNDQRTYLVLLQYRPPEINPDIEAGQFQWDAFKPEKNRAGHFILIPAQKKEYQRDAALVSTYTPLSANTEISVNVKSSGLRRIITPQLLFFQKEPDNPFSIRVSRNGMPYFTARLVGPSGRLYLPPLSKGPQVLKFHTSKSVDLMMNQITPSPGEDQFHKRFAYRLTPGNPISIPYIKQTADEETLSLAVAFPFIAPQRLKISATLHCARSLPWGPFKELTIQHRTFSIRSDNNGPVYILNSSQPMMGSRHRCFFPIRSDLKPGKYRISLSLNGTKRAYVVLYRVLPGRYAQQKLLKEAKHPHEKL
jgi:hypothetical protein